MIRYDPRDHKWLLYTHDGSRVLGTHDSREAALRQERAIQWSKHSRRNPSDRLYCYKPLDLFWTENERAQFSAFHATPYLKSVLEEGCLKPPTLTGKSVLGENVGYGSTIRGCLLSFYDQFQIAMSGCYSQALFAILSKNLLSASDLRDLIQAEVDVIGIQDADGKCVNLDDSEIIDLMVARYRAGDIGTLFKFLERFLGFNNPRILTDEWVNDLPDTIEGVLNGIGVLEVDIDRKFIADPSAFTDGTYSIYGIGWAEPKGGFGRDLSKFTHSMYTTESSDDELSYHSAYVGSYLAREFNKACRQKGSAHYEIDTPLASLLDADIYDEWRYDAEIDSESGEITLDSEVTFVKSVDFNVEDVAIWNPVEDEWRIPAPKGISVNESNVVALAGDIQIAMGGARLLYPHGTSVRGRRKNPKNRKF